MACLNTRITVRENKRDLATKHCSRYPKSGVTRAAVDPCQGLRSLEFLLAVQTVMWGLAYFFPNQFLAVMTIKQDMAPFRGLLFSLLWHKMESAINFCLSGKRSRVYGTGCPEMQICALFGDFPTSNVVPVSGRLSRFSLLSKPPHPIWLRSLWSGPFPSWRVQNAQCQRNFALCVFAKNLKISWDWWAENLWHQHIYFAFRVHDCIARNLESEDVQAVLLFACQSPLNFVSKPLTTA